MTCDPVDNIIAYCFLAGCGCVCLLCWSAYRAGAIALESAEAILKQTIRLRDEARVERDKWKFAKMLSDATNEIDEGNA